MSSSSNSSSSSSSSNPSNGVLHPALTLLREDFHVAGARRAHSRFLDTSTNQPKWFAQHRRTVLEAALFAGRDKIGQVTEDNLELREVRVASDKLYTTSFFASHRRWKGPDGVKYSWQATEEGDLRLLDTKTNLVHVYANRQDSNGTRLTISSQVHPFIELILLTFLQAEFEYLKKLRKRQQEEDDKDQELGVW